MTYIIFKLWDIGDEVAEWLRRWTANPLGSPRVGSNPILVVHIFVKHLLVDTCSLINEYKGAKLHGKIEIFTEYDLEMNMSKDLSQNIKFMQLKLKFMSKI